MCTPNAYCEAIDPKLFDLVKRRTMVIKSFYKDPLSIMKMFGETDESIAKRVYARMFDTVKHHRTLFRGTFDEKVKLEAEIVGDHARLIVRQALPENKI